MMYRIWKCTTRILSKFKRLKHGRQQSEYLNRSRTLTLETGDVKMAKDLALAETIATVRNENAKLKKENEELKKQAEELKKRNGDTDK